MHTHRSAVSVALAFFGLFAAGCGDDSSNNNTTGTGGSGGSDTSSSSSSSSSSSTSSSSSGSQASTAIMDIGVREVVDQAKFDQYFPQIVSLISKQNGYVANRDFVSFYSLAPDPMPMNPIRVGLTQWNSAEEYMNAIPVLLNDPVWMNYFPSVKGIATLIVKPYKDGETIDVANIIGSGQVLEVAIRDLSKISDQQAFFAAKEAFIKILTSAPGVVREYEWVSATPMDNYYVGMTQYESQAAFGQVAQDPKIVGSPEAQNFFMNYPPMVAQVTIAAP